MGAPTELIPLPALALPEELPTFVIAEDVRDISPLAKRAANELQEVLRGWASDRTHADAARQLSVEGKMFGVLLAQTPGRNVVALRAFSGMLNRSWFYPGFVGPAFDDDERQRFWPEAAQEMAAIDQKLVALKKCAEYQQLQVDERALSVAHRHAHKTLQHQLLQRRVARHAQRLALRTMHQPTGSTTLELDRQSSNDKVMRKTMLASQRREREELQAKLAPLRADILAMQKRLADASRRHTIALHATYHLRNATGQTTGLQQIYAPGTPPSGAGDCAGPKLLQAAYMSGFVPLALAEFWWGAPMLGKDRRHGRFYTPCRSKCLPMLRFMAQGLPTARP